MLPCLPPGTAFDLEQRVRKSNPDVGQFMLWELFLMMRLPDRREQLFNGAAFQGPMVCTCFTHNMHRTIQSCASQLPRLARCISSYSDAIR